jgi:hypothetical protein
MNEGVPPMSSVEQSLPAPPANARLPRQIPFIIGNEACERFSFYGMRNILTPFLVSSLLLYAPEAERAGIAKDVFHSFVIGVYFFPLLGGWIADRLIGASTPASSSSRSVPAASSRWSSHSSAISSISRTSTSRRSRSTPSTGASTSGRSSRRFSCRSCCATMAGPWRSAFRES